jgi:SAM-dependent methyltransferase
MWGQQTEDRHRAGEERTVEEYRDVVRQTVLEAPTFVRATFSGQQRGETIAWGKVTLRPVEVKGKRHIQFAYYDDRKCITKNYADAELTTSLESLLTLPFKNLHVATTAEEIQVTISKSGKPLVHRKRVSAPIEIRDTHDRAKDYLLPPGKPDPYLQAIGFMTTDGQIKADRQKKFRQINEFLRMLAQTGEIEKMDTPTLSVVDFGCGNAYLTFGVYHYLNHILGRPAQLIGVDVQGALLEKHQQTAKTLGWDRITFERTTIAEYAAPAPPDIVLALHACNTATDEALTQGILSDTRLIISVPCCHHHLQEQLRQQETPAPFRPLMRHGILFERDGDLLTDAFRAQILRIMGYQTEVLQFISSEHTAKNLMIRAVRTPVPAPPAFVEEYRQMKAYWNVTPYLETLLGDTLLSRLG